MNLSTKAKEAIKTALAITITYALVLQLGWDKPMWAVLAISCVSLSTVGMSINKAALRMFGTVVAALAALVLLALFPQDPWLFMLALSVYVGFCTYKMGGKKNSYFWNVCGFVCVIISLEAGANPSQAFSLAVLRAQQTCLGIMIYSLISLFLWPKNTRSAFLASASELFSTQRQLYLASLELMSGAGDAAHTAGLKLQELQQRTEFGQLLDAAETDTEEVREQRYAWRVYQNQLTRLAVVMELWREGFKEVHSIDFETLIPNQKESSDELEIRFAQIERMLGNQPPEHSPTIISLDLAESAVKALTHFEKAALVVMRSRLQELEKLTRDLFHTMSVIKGYRQEHAVTLPVLESKDGYIPDPERFMSVFRIMSIIWLGYLALNYVDSIPGGSVFLILAVSLGMAFATTPQLPVSMLFVPTGCSVLFASLVYMFVMPQLSNFAQLGLLVFVVVFAICYLFAEPKQVLGRALGIAMFAAICAISNPQHYSFQSVATTAMLFPLGFVLLMVTAYIPFSAHPEQAFLRLLGRYFRSCEALMITLLGEQRKPATSFEQRVENYHRYEIRTLPQKLAMWGRFINPKLCPGTTPQQVQALVASLQALSARIDELSNERETPQAPLLVEELRGDVRLWHLKVQESFQSLANSPSAGQPEQFQAGFVEVVNRLEQRIRSIVDKAAKAQLSEEEGVNFYRLLGAYRGVSESLFSYAGCAAVIDWATWQEDRF